MAPCWLACSLGSLPRSVPFCSLSPHCQRVGGVYAYARARMRAGCRLDAREMMRSDGMCGETSASLSRPQSGLPFVLCWVVCGSPACIRSLSSRRGYDGRSSNRDQQARQANTRVLELPTSVKVPTRIAAGCAFTRFRVLVHRVRSMRALPFHPCHPPHRTLARDSVR